MSILQFLQLQPVDTTDDTTVSPFDEYQHDDIIDLNEEIDEAAFSLQWEAEVNELREDTDKLTFTDE
jgi:hypothetical protein